MSSSLGKSQVTATGTGYVDQLMSGLKWQSGNLTFAFAASEAALDYTLSNSAYFGALTSSEQTAFKSVMAKWTAVAGVTFTQVADPATADIAIYWYRSPGVPAGLINSLSDGPGGGDIQLRDPLTAADLGQPGTFTYLWALRAVGEALGLKSPGAAASVNPGSFPTSNDVYISDSVMSEYAYAGHGTSQMGATSYPSNPMPNDIAAIQALYGVSGNAMTANIGDTTYTFDPSASVIFQTRYDGGGSDTFNFQTYTTNLSVDLRAGGWTDLGGQYATLDTGDATKKPPGNIATPLGGGVTLIENAYGGSGYDVLIGNAANNILSGNGGNDVLKPGAGDDTLTGGAGADTFDFSDGGTGEKRVMDFALGDVIKLRDAVVGGVIAHSGAAGLTAGQVAILSNGAANVLYVGLDATPGSDMSIELANGIVAGNLSVSGQTIRYTTLDVTAPQVSAVSVPPNATYKAGDALNFTVNFDEAVTVVGAPQLALTIGSTARQADYVSGSGTSALVFRYTVQNSDMDADGITISALGLNGGALKDSVGNDASLTLNNAGATSSVLVDGVSPFNTAVYVPNSGYYRTGEVLTFSLGFSERVDVTGTPQLGLTVGSATRQADYVGNSGADTLVFRYTIQAGDHAPSGIGVSGLTLNGGTVKDLAGNAASLAATGASSARVDMAQPVVASVSVPATGAYKAGDALSFTVALDETVIVTGTPQLALTVGSTVRQANYVSGSGTSTLVFRYTVQSGETDADGIAVGALGLNGGTLKDQAGNAANLTLNSVGATASVLVDTTAPTVGSATGPSAATYKTGDALTFTVNFSEAVTVTGAPKLALTLDTGGTVDATYVSGSGTSALVFRYIVQAGNADADGVALGSSIALNGGTLKDAAGNDAALTGVGVTGLAGVKIDGVVPTVQSLNRVGAALTKAATQAFTVTFSEAVTGVDASDFVLTSTGTATGTIASVSGSGTTYTVNLNTVSGDGTLRLDLKNSGTGIADAAGNAIATGFATGQSFTIDNTAATPTIAVVAGDNTISAGEVSGLSLSGTLEAGASVALTVGGVAKTATVSGTTWSYAVTQADIDAWGAGAKTVAVTATDAVGNVSATATRVVTIDAGALTSASQPQPQPQPPPLPPTPPPSLVDLTSRPPTVFVQTALDNLRISPDSPKLAALTTILPDGTIVQSTAAQVRADINNALAAYTNGQISQAVFEQRLTQAVAPTTGVAHDAYKFFTGAPPTRVGMSWLIDSVDNPSDLTDGYYARFSVENRYINFAVNLGKVGAGRASFESKYGGLTFADAVAKAYDTIIGGPEAQGVGVDVPAALRYIQGQETYFRALGGDDLGAKAAMAGYILSLGTSAHLGKYYAALEDYVVAAITGGASAAPAWELG